MPVSRFTVGGGLLCLIHVEDPIPASLHNFIVPYVA